MRDLVPALDALDRALAHGSAVLDEAVLRPAAEVAERVRRRRGFLGETTVLALAGGTGSGKSSLLNALAGEKVAETGVRRPVTDRPLAWIPADPEPGLVRLLDALGVEERIGQERFPHLAVVDLPDFDSVVAGHRAMVDRLLPQVDAVLWVLDPEKYNDRIFHREYLAPRARYREQFVFVLNQVDRLEPAQREAVLADLRHTLKEDGIEDPLVLATAADPPGGESEGVEALRARLAERMETKRVAVAKLAEDLRGAGRGLWEAAGLDDRGSPAFRERWEERSRSAARTLAGMVAGEELERLQEREGERRAVAAAGGPVGRLVARLPRTALGRALGGAAAAAAPGRTARAWAARSGLEEAVGDLTDFVTELSFEVGGAFGSRIRESLGPDRIEGETGRAVQAAVEAAGSPADPAPAGWWGAGGAVQWIMVGAVVAGGLWAWAEPAALTAGRWPWPLLLAGAGLVGAMVVSRAVRWSGRRRGRAATRTYRDRVEDLVAGELEERIGTPLRHLIRDRGVLAAALAELGVELARADPERMGER